MAKKKVWIPTVLISSAAALITGRWMRKRKHQPKDEMRPGEGI